MITPLHVLLSGASESAVTLVFLHYFGGSCQSWSDVIPLLDRDHRCIAIDLRGFGSSPPLQPGTTVHDMADDVVETLRELGVTSYALIGHSMGAKIAWVIAARQSAGPHTFLLHSLVLVAPSPPEPEPMSAEERPRLLHAFGNRAEAERTLQGIVLQRLPDEQHDIVIDDALRASRSGWEWWLKVGSLEDVSDVALGINVPTLVIAGANDSPLTPDFVQRAVVLRIDGANMEIIENVKHLIPFERPEVLARLIRQHCRVR